MTAPRGLSSPAAAGGVDFAPALPYKSLESPAPKPSVQEKLMQGPLRGILAGVAAWKLGGGCISTVLIFVIVFWLLGYVNC